MKYFLLLSACLSLSSCNTIVGMYRDTKAAVIWTKNKVSGSGSSSNTSQGYESYDSYTNKTHKTPTNNSDPLGNIENAPVY